MSKIKTPELHVQVSFVNRGDRNRTRNLPYEFIVSAIPLGKFLTTHSRTGLAPFNASGSPEALLNFLYPFPMSQMLL